MKFYPGTDILYLRAVGIDFIILNSLEAVTDLLDKRSSIYSSRLVHPWFLECSTRYVLCLILSV